jgi:WD40 repeat protein
MDLRVRQYVIGLLGLFLLVGMGVVAFLIRRSTNGTPPPDITIRTETPVVGLAFSHDGGRLAVAQANAVKIWDMQSKSVTSTLGGTGPNLKSLEFAQQGAVMATLDSQGGVKLWDTTNGSLIDDLRAKLGKVSCMAVSPTSHLLALGGRLRRGTSENACITVWDASRRDRIAEIPIESKECTTLSFSTDGETLVASYGPSPQVIHALNIRTRGVREILRGPTAAEDIVAISPDGNNVACFSTVPFHAARVLNIATGKLIGEVPLPDSGGIWDLWFSNSGHLFGAVPAPVRNGQSLRVEICDGVSFEPVASIALNMRWGIARLSPGGDVLAVAHLSEVLVWRTSALIGRDIAYGDNRYNGERRDEGHENREVVK